MRIKCKKTEQLTVIPELSTEDLNFVNDFLNKLGLNYSEIDEQGLCVDFKIYGTAVSVVKHLKRLQDSNIHVYVVPGNHDINNSDAKRFNK